MATKKVTTAKKTPAKKTIQESSVAQVVVSKKSIKGDIVANYKAAEAWKASRRSEQMKAIAKTAHANRAAAKQAETMGAPVTPLTNLLINAGFAYVRSEPQDEQNTAHGYAHPDGAAAMFIHANVSYKVGARWIVVREGKKVEGKTAKELAVALIKSEVIPANVTAALSLLHKVTKGTYHLMNLAGDQNYSVRLQLLKKLKPTEKILVKDSGVNNVVKAFYAALDIKGVTAAAMAAAFEARCVELYKAEQKVDRVIARVDKAESKELVRRTGGVEPIIDGKPVLPSVKKLSAKKQAETDAKAKESLRVELAAKTGIAPEASPEDDPKTVLAAQIAAKRKQEEYTPLAVPRPDASIAVNLDDICYLEDPNNGISLLCLEKPNSQGAICVYNNGSRVAAGVVPTEILITLRPLVSEDLIRDVNQLLHPMTAGVIVTPVAETHLTAVLAHCKEKIDMATETAIKTKKFAAPVKTTATAVKKAVAPKAEKAVKAPKESKPRINSDAKITIIIKENPYREGTRAFASYEAIKKSKTVAAFKELCAAKDTKTALAPKFTYLAWSMVPHGNTPALVKIA